MIISVPHIDDYPIVEENWKDLDSGRHFFASPVWFTWDNVTAVAAAVTSRNAA